MSKESQALDYAKEVAGSLIEKALEEAYIKGYEAGVESVEHPQTTIVENGVTYVDLGLPSGTLWSRELRGDNFGNSFLSYSEALKYNIPTLKQTEELRSNTEYRIDLGINVSRVLIIGPNGNTLYWDLAGVRENTYEVQTDKELLFWVKGKMVNNNASCFNIDHQGQQFRDLFTGLHLRLALVKTPD